MAGAEKLERLRQFLRELSPAARTMLTNELERALLRGDDGDSVAELILRQLRLIAREQRDGAPRIDHAARLFFRPFEPFLVDEAGDQNYPGPVARASVQTLWNWIGRDLLPDEARSLTAKVNGALAKGDKAGAEASVNAFQERVLVAIDESIAAATDDDAVRRYLTSKIGTSHANEDAATLRCVLRGRNALMKLGEDLPLHIGKLDPAALRACKTLIDGIAAQDQELLLYALLTVMNRLAAPWQLIRFGIAAADSNNAARVAETNYAVSVNIVLAELQRMVGVLRRDLRNSGGMAVSALLKTIHDSVRGLGSELVIPVNSNWGRTLTAQRTEIAELLRIELDAVPGRVRRMLRPRRAAEIRANSVLDDSEVSDTEALVALVDACRLFAGELAINEITHRANAELRQYLDAATQVLLDGLRHVTRDEQRFRQSQFEAGRRFCAVLFGPSYAEALGRAAQLAAGPTARALRA